jgi:hypothetical protein
MKRPSKAELIVALQRAIRVYQTRRVKTRETVDDRNFCERILERTGHHQIQ